jgi:protein-S-isoprenylcysteine O-methyltransferase Ste14
MTPISLEGIAWLAWFVYWRVAARGAQRAEWRESKLSTLIYRLPLVLAAVLLVVSKVELGYLQILLLPFGELYAWTGALFTVLGLVLAVWARIHLGRNWSARVELKQSHFLIQTGPYRATRHPIYVGLLSAVLGTSITRGDIRGLLAFLLVLVAFFLKSRRENALLRSHFGDEYQRYHRDLKPRIGTNPTKDDNSSATFSVSLTSHPLEIKNDTSFARPFHRAPHRSRNQWAL